MWIDGKPVREMRTRRDVKHTLKTREKEALNLEVGRWLSKPITHGLEKLKDLLKADKKRARETMDSYQLVMDLKNQTSRALTFNEYWNIVGDVSVDYEEWSD